jgi:hypothetical protein
MESHVLPRNAISFTSLRVLNHCVHHCLVAVLLSENLTINKDKQTPRHESDISTYRCLASCRIDSIAVELWNSVLLWKRNCILKWPTSYWTEIIKIFFFLMSFYDVAYKKSWRYWKKIVKTRILNCLCPKYSNLQLWSYFTNATGIQNAWHISRLLVSSRLLRVIYDLHNSQHIFLNLLAEVFGIVSNFQCHFGRVTW